MVRLGCRADKMSLVPVRSECMSVYSLYCFYLSRRIQWGSVSLHIRHDLRYVHGTCERTVLFGTVPTTRYRPVRTHSDIPVTKSGM
jgi:hypothetical protein